MTTDKKKLYIVRVDFEYAVLADDEHEATRCAAEVISDFEIREFCSVSEVKPGRNGEIPRPDSWGDADLVYGSHTEDITLAQAITKYVKKAPGGAKGKS